MTIDDCFLHSADIRGDDGNSMSKTGQDGKRRVLVPDGGYNDYINRVKNFLNIIKIIRSPEFNTGIILSCLFDTLSVFVFME